MDKLSANWQSRTGSIQMTYYITTIFPVLFLSSVLISPLHPCLDNSSNWTGVLEQWSEAATSADKVTGSLVWTTTFPLCLIPHVLCWFSDPTERDPVKYVTLTSSVQEETTPAAFLQGDREAVATVASEVVSWELVHCAVIPGLCKRAQASLPSCSPGPDLWKAPPPPDLSPVPGA